MTTARRASWRPWAGLTPPSAAPTAPCGTVTFPRCMCGRNGRRPRTGGHGDLLHCSPHTLPDAHPVTTRAAGMHRAVRRQLDTGENTARCLTSHPLLHPRRRRQNWRIWPFAFSQSIGQPAAPSRRSI